MPVIKVRDVCTHSELSSAIGEFCRSFIPPICTLILTIRFTNRKVWMCGCKVTSRVSRGSLADISL